LVLSQQPAGGQLGMHVLCSLIMCHILEVLQSLQLIGGSWAATYHSKPKQKKQSFVTHIELQAPPAWQRQRN
jgi:hypothetical protein